LRFGVAPENASSASDPLAAMLADIRALTKVVAPVSGNEPIVLVASAARAKTTPLDKRIDLSSFLILPSNALANWGTRAHRSRQGVIGVAHSARQFVAVNCPGRRYS
jgi:hypothetical protein